MPDKPKLPKTANNSRVQAADEEQDVSALGKASEAQKHLEGWLRSKELQPPK